MSSLMLTDEQRAAISERLQQQRSSRPGKLTPEQRTRLVLDFLEHDVKPAELARRYGVSKQTVAYHLTRAAKG